MSGGVEGQRIEFHWLDHAFSTVHCLIPTSCNDQNFRERCTAIFRTVFAVNDFRGGFPRKIKFHVRDMEGTEASRWSAKMLVVFA